MWIFNFIITSAEFIGYGFIAYWLFLFGEIIFNAIRGINAKEQTNVN